MEFSFLYVLKPDSGVTPEIPQVASEGIFDRNIKFES